MLVLKLYLMINLFIFFDRDGNSSQHVVWSHIFLLLACALPVWTYTLLTDFPIAAPLMQYIQGETGPYLVMFEKLFPQLGSLTVGVGDALVRT